MTDKAIIEKIMEEKRPTKFNYPKGEPKRLGEIIKRSYIKHENKKDGVVFWFVIDIIKISNEPTSPWMRIGYYREKPKGVLRWAGQTAPMAPVNVWKKILNKQKMLFKNL